MLELLYATGLRVSELVKLKRHQWHDGWIVVTGKGDKDRLVPYGDSAKVAVEQYLATRIDTTEAMFLTIRGGAMSRQNFWTRLNTYVKKAGVRGHVSSLLGTRSPHLLVHGADLRAVQPCQATRTSARRNPHPRCRSDRALHAEHHPGAEP